MTGVVKYIDNTQFGADVLSGQAGALISVLDTALVNGFNTNTLDSLTVSSGVATGSRSAGHNYRPGDVLEVSGATPAGLNGEKKVLSTTTTSFTFDATGVADGAATGTIVTKIAPLGWSKAFAGTNLAAYRSQSIGSTQCYLRVDDTGTRSARIVGYESMTDIDTGVDPFPTEAQFSGGLYWHKSNDANSTPRKWWVIGDADRFILGIYYNDLNDNAEIGYGAVVHFFGDFISHRPGDSFNCAITGHHATASSSTSVALNGPGIVSGATSGSGSYLVRDVAQIAKSPKFSVNPGAPNTNIGSGVNYHSGGGNYENEYPSVVDGGLVFSEILVNEALATTEAIRGIIPGAYWIQQKRPASDGVVVSGSPGLPGRELIIMETGQAGNTVGRGRVAIDITGPWD